MRSKFFDFFSKFDAVGNFEKKFMTYTENSWLEREFFVQKPGKYQILSAERDKERLEFAKTNEKEIMALIKEFFQKNENDFSEFLRFVWSIENVKKVYAELSLDPVRLPLGSLKIERIKKSQAILVKI
jgi:hypothetical protein